MVGRMFATMTDEKATAPSDDANLAEEVTRLNEVTADLVKRVEALEARAAQESRDRKTAGAKAKRR